MIGGGPVPSSMTTNTSENKQGAAALSGFILLGKLFNLYTI
jgi:hypothetical protein